MAEASTPVKRRYASPRRTEQARATRRTVVAAAAQLFMERGYAATSIEDIAVAAGVARPTVFAAGGSKPALLQSARDVALAGDDADVPVPARPWFREALAQEDPVALLTLQARNYRQIQGRAARLERVLDEAAAADPRVRPLREMAHQQRLLGAGLVATRLAEIAGGRLRGDTAVARDLLYTLASPAVYLLLTEDLGWSADDYEQWLAATLQAQLLQPGS